MTRRRTSAPVSKKKTIPVKRVSSPETFHGGISAVELMDLFEDVYTDRGGPDGTWYRRTYQEYLATFLAREGGKTVRFAELLEEVDEAIGVETAMRQAGFIVGFQCCRRLLLGELDVVALKGGAK